jgi:hypothetical protein
MEVSTEWDSAVVDSPEAFLSFPSILLFSLVHSGTITHHPADSDDPKHL